MALFWVRAILLGICLTAGAFAGPGFLPGEMARWIGAAGGLLLFLGCWAAERWVRQAPSLVVFGGGVGVLVGLLALAAMRAGLGVNDPLILLPLGGCLLYLAGAAGARGVRAFRVAPGKPGVAASIAPKILDTSAIIDGRVADMVDLGFIGGPLVVPQFILNELQGIADSTDPLKRARGRRGLSVLERLQAMEGVEVRITDQDFPKVKEVDAKLVSLAKTSGATLITNDFNLSKVAELQGVRVLNINELANALRPVVLPGESVQVTLQKEGKEPGQGVGYLEDGTMVVVEQGQSLIGQPVKAVVTSVLQTSAGRMIFARPEGAEPEAESGKRRRVWRRRA
ncbi:MULTISPECIES: PIN/TRAM domain-containing protein [Deferrisoma]